jgi:hypothetical protein
MIIWRRMRSTEHAARVKNNTLINANDYMEEMRSTEHVARVKNNTLINANDYMEEDEIDRTRSTSEKQYINKNVGSKA